MSSGFVVHITRAPNNGVGHAFLEMRLSGVTRYVELTTVSGVNPLGYAVPAVFKREHPSADTDGKFNILVDKPYENQTTISSQFIPASDHDVNLAFGSVVARANSRDGFTNYELNENSCITLVKETLEAGGYTGSVGALFTADQVQALGKATWLSQHTLMREFPGYQHPSYADSMYGRFIDELGVARCFLAGTPILMADGTSKPIEDIRPGDEVASFDPNAQQGLGPLQPGKVTRTCPPSALMGQNRVFPDGRISGSS